MGIHQEARKSAQDEMAERAILNKAVAEYFTEIGCWVLSHEYWSTIRLPLATTCWSIDFIGDLVYLTETKAGFRRTDRDPFKISVTDPDSFPKMLEHMQKKSKFLKGGTNHKPFIPKAL